MEISKAMKDYLYEIEIRKYTPKTIRSYRNNLNLFLRFFQEETDIKEIEDVSLSEVRKFTQHLIQNGKKGSYINSLLKVAKRLFNTVMKKDMVALTQRKTSIRY